MALWNRRLTVDVAIHRWDAEHPVAADAGPPLRPLDGEVAAAGIEEVVIESLPGLLAQEATGELSGTLHLHSRHTCTPRQLAGFWVAVTLVAARHSARVEAVDIHTTVASCTDSTRMSTGRR